MLKKLSAVISVLICTWIAGVIDADAKIVFSELMWMGTDLSTADEWIELHNTASGSIDISGWTVSVIKGEDEDVTHTFATGAIIGSGSYLLIANYAAEYSRLSHVPDVVTTAVSLPNSKLHVVLRDSGGVIIDTADDGVGKPMAGENASGTGARASMAREFLMQSGSLVMQWRTSRTSLGFDDGTPAFGTPGKPWNSGTGIDVFAPQDASNLSAALSGSLLSVTWSRSSSVDVAHYEITVAADSVSGSIVSHLDASSVSYEKDDERLASGATVTLIARDWQGHASTGVTIAIEPELRDEKPGNVPLPAVRITEVLANPVGRDDHEWIEIANATTGSVSIAGYALTDGTRSYVIPEHRTASGAWPPVSQTGFVLAPGEHVSFRKSVTDIALQNAGEALSIHSGETLIDEFAYPETTEGVSVALSGALVVARCVPTEGSENRPLVVDPRVEIQNGPVTYGSSGEVLGKNKLSLNLRAYAQTGSLSLAECAWEYSDGYVSDSCNPPSHSFAEGIHDVRLTIETYCGTTIRRSLTAVVSNNDENLGDISHKSGQKKEQKICSVLSYGGMRISEFLPDPYGNEASGEWIELQNVSDGGIDLCGWSIDDASGGSKPYALDGETVAAGEFLILPREQTGIALNNDGDEVRLLAPSAFEDENVEDVVSFKGTVTGESHALREDGHFVRTPFLTPGKPNEFRSEVRRFDHESVVVEAALPNPVGKDDGNEWVELRNVTDESVDLSGWILDNKPGSSKPHALSGVVLEGREVIRLSVRDTGVTLVNSRDSVRLLDPDGYVASVFGWTEAVEGRVYRRPVIVTEHAEARVINVVDGDTIDIVLTNPDQFDRLPNSVVRRWLGVQHTDRSFIRLRLIGIDTPETVHPLKDIERFGAKASAETETLTAGKHVTVAFDAELWDKYDRLLGYVFIGEEMLQARLLRSGLASAYLRFPFTHERLFLEYEREAKQSKLGMWLSEQVAKYAREARHIEEVERAIYEEGITLSVSPKSGPVASGTVIETDTSVASNVFVSVDSGAFLPMSRAMVITRPARLTFMAERETSSGTVVSDEVSRTYTVLGARHDAGMVLSEVYPSPQSDEVEWIELYNASSDVINIGHWLIDDAENSGSKPWRIPWNTVVESFSHVTFSFSGSSFTLNNGGERVRLLTPDGTEITAADYPKTKRGMAYAFTQSCMSEVSTPGSQNTCIILDEQEPIDADLDLVDDNHELFVHGTVPGSPDTDGDGWMDGFEIEIGTDPLSETESDRSLIAAYNAFVLDRLNPKVRTFKRKGTRVSGKIDPAFKVNKIFIQNEPLYIELGQKSWRSYVGRNVQPGSYPVDIEVIDPMGKSIRINAAVQASVMPSAESEGVAPSPRSRRERVKYRNVIEDAAISSDHVIDEISALFDRLNSHVRLDESYGLNVRDDGVLVLLMMLSMTLMTSLFGRRKVVRQSRM